MGVWWVGAGSGLSSSSAFVCVAALSVLAALQQTVPRLVRTVRGPLAACPFAFNPHTSMPCYLRTYDRRGMSIGSEIGPRLPQWQLWMPPYVTPGAASKALIIPADQGL